MAQQFHHFVPSPQPSNPVDVGREVTAVCGFTWVPTAYGEEAVDGYPLCPGCEVELMTGYMALERIVEEQEDYIADLEDALSTQSVFDRLLRKISNG